MQQHKHTRKPDLAVSETIGAVMLVSVVVVAIAILGVALTSQGTPQKIPALDAVISNVDRTVFVYHDGGDTLSRQDMYLMVNGQRQDFTKNGDPGWTTWSTGESLTYQVPGTDPISTVQVVYDNSATSAVLSAANFGPSGMPTTVPTLAGPPSVSGISPPAGPLAGGTTVTITGTSLAGATSVKFGGASAVVLTNTNTQITATSPAGSAGTVDVTVTTPIGTSATSPADLYTYTASPVVTGVSPAAGPVAGGTSLTISGTGFTGATSVKFGAIVAPILTNTGTQITTTSPAGSAGTVDVTVTTPGGTSATSPADQFIYAPVPTVTGISPSAGSTAGGTTVTVTGTGLSTANFVTFDTTVNATGAMTVNSDTQLTVTSPAHATGTVDVTITTPGGTSATSVNDHYTYSVAPTVTGLAPAGGLPAGGTTVIITGTGFTGASSVKFGTTANATGAMTVNSATQITVTSPAHAAGTVDVTVTALGGTSATSSADLFTYASAPAVTGISPTGGSTAGGTTVTITGTDFIGAMNVKFGTTANATGAMTVDSATQITVASPAHSAGLVDVTVTTPSGTSALVPADQYTYTTAPTVTAVSPSSGPTAGGTSVTITGTGFTGATAVSFGATTTPILTNTGTQITANAPAHAIGTIHVTVTTPGGTSATSPADQFTYYVIQTITGSGTSTVPVGATNVQYCVVAGGGGGGRYGGGGGAGGFLTNTITGGLPASYAVTIGAAGAAGPNSGSGKGGDGGNSVFGPVTATGGGGGGSRRGPTAANWNGNNGGSGGGGVGAGTAGAGTALQGNAGGAGSTSGGVYYGGGGGGAGSSGVAASGAVAGNGGAGNSCPINSGMYAGGGGGGSNSAGTAGTAVNGGGAGGDGGAGTAGTTNTGGGGGGGGNTGNGGAGGSGIVILKYY